MSPNPPQPPIIEWRASGLVMATSSSLAKGARGHVPTRPLEGWAMTYARVARDGRTTIPTVDRQDQVMEAAAELGHVDWSAYVEHGLWNDSHTHALVGVPTSLTYVNSPDHALAKAHRKLGFFTGGHLWDRNDPASWELYAPPRPDAGKQIRRGDPQLVPTEEELAKADRFWELASMLKGVGRPLGLSVEGAMMLSPCRKRILRAWVTQTAVCELPVNPDATAEPVDMLKAIVGTPLAGLRQGMVGANPCARCRCPGGVCAAGGLPLIKSTPMEVHPPSTTGLSGPINDATEPEANEDVEVLRAHYDRLVARIVERWHVTEDVAREYVDAAIANLSRPRDPERITT